MGDKSLSVRCSKCLNNTHVLRSSAANMFTSSCLNCDSPLLSKQFKQEVSKLNRVECLKRIKKANSKGHEFASCPQCTLTIHADRLITHYDQKCKYALNKNNISEFKAQSSKPINDQYWGRHLWVDRGTYDHHGIGVGCGMVIHYEGGLGASGPIRRVTLDQFANGDKINIKKSPRHRYSRQDAVNRAESRLGEDDYDLFGNNCEHFVNWCIYGDHKSKQVDKARNVLLTGAALGALGTVGIVTAPIAVGAGALGGIINSILDDD